MFQVISLKDTENSVYCSGAALYLDKIQYSVIANLLADILNQQTEQEDSDEPTK